MSNSKHHCNWFFCVHNILDSYLHREALIIAFPTINKIGGFHKHTKSLPCLQITLTMFPQNTPSGQIVFLTAKRLYLAICPRTFHSLFQICAVLCLQSYTQYHSTLQNVLVESCDQSLLMHKILITRSVHQIYLTLVKSFHHQRIVLQSTGKNTTYQLAYIWHYFWCANHKIFLISSDIITLITW